MPDLLQRPAVTVGHCQRGAVAITAASVQMFRRCLPIALTLRGVQALTGAIGTHASGGKTLVRDAGVQMVDGAGATVFSASDVLGPERFAMRRAPPTTRSTCPFDALAGTAPRLKPTLAHAVRRDVRFAAQ